MAMWTGLGDNTELFWAVLSQLASHTDDQEFEGWHVQGFDSRSWTPE
jgi:hypothetical protein